MHCDDWETKRPRFILAEKVFTCHDEIELTNEAFELAFPTKTKLGRSVSRPTQCMGFSNEDEARPFRLPANAKH